MAQKIDPMGVTADFKKRKSFTFYDPYNEEANQEFHSILRWAQKDDLYRASLVIEQFKHQWTALNNEVKQNSSNVNFIEQERLAQTSELLDRLSDVKIIDAPVLLKLYELYRYRPEN